MLVFIYRQFLHLSLFYRLAQLISPKEPMEEIVNLLARYWQPDPPFQKPFQDFDPELQQLTVDHTTDHDLEQQLLAMDLLMEAIAEVVIIIRDYCTRLSSPYQHLQLYFFCILQLSMQDLGNMHLWTGIMLARPICLHRNIRFPMHIRWMLPRLLLLHLVKKKRELPKNYQLFSSTMVMEKKFSYVVILLIIAS